MYCATILLNFLVNIMHYLHNSLLSRFSFTAAGRKILYVPWFINFKYVGLVNFFYDTKPTEFNGNFFLAYNENYYKDWVENYFGCLQSHFNKSFLCLFITVTWFSSISFQKIILLFVCNRLAGFKFESSHCFRSKTFFGRGWEGNRQG